MAFPGYKGSLIVILLVAQSGCATLPPNAKQYSSFAKYAESVFRHQNELTSRLIMMHDYGASKASKKVQNAEQEMNEACYPLNEYAERKMAGESMGIFFMHEVQGSVEKCDRKIQKLESLLKKASH